ncbi:transposase [Burkholderia sp. MSMB2157WGS]|uniref:transposase n=1 Tax=Burkholderia TaxID=32008 RepID=UPI00068AA6B7|nr:hypothetical protein WT53_05285 [Burkholderia sp. MSMB2157WGS]
MKKRFTEEQIISILKEAEAGLKPAKLCRKYGISDATSYTWKAKKVASPQAKREAVRILMAERAMGVTLGLRAGRDFAPAVPLRITPPS